MKAVTNITLIFKQEFFSERSDRRLISLLILEGTLQTTSNYFKPSGI